MYCRPRAKKRELTWFARVVFRCTTTKFALLKKISLKKLSSNLIKFTLQDGLGAPLNVIQALH